MSKQDQSPINTILYIALGAIILLVLIRLPIFRLFFWWIIPLLILGALGYFIYLGVESLRSRRRREAFEKTTAGRTYAKLEECRQLYQKNEDEIRDIRTNIRELKDKISDTYHISSHYEQKSKELLAGFQSELNLRQAKAGFYQSCIRKLESLLHNYQLADELERKKKQLRRLQENNYEELAKLEEIKSDLEMDSTYLETIDELSLRMLESDTVDDAEHLRLELEEMTRELDELRRDRD
jgi:chromosome segregation ATPase